MIRQAVCVAVLLVLIGAPTIFAGGEPLPWEDTLIAEWEGGGAGWMALRVLIGEGRSHLSAFSGGVAPMHATGTALYRADGPQVDMFSYVSSGVRLTQTYAQAGDASFLVLPPAESPFGAAGAGNGLSWGYGAVAPLPAGEYVAVFWSSAKETQHEFQVRGTASFEVVSVSSGPEAYILSGRDFKGVFSAGSDTSASASGVGGGAPVVGALGASARAQVDASVSIEVAERFVGSFEARPASALAGIHTGIEDLRVENAAGARSCDCVFDEATPGAWTFRATGAAVGTPDSVQIAVNGAAFRWP